MDTVGEINGNVSMYCVKGGVGELSSGIRYKYHLQYRGGDRAGVRYGV